MISGKVLDRDTGWKKWVKRLDKAMRSPLGVKVGIRDSSRREGGLSNLEIGLIHEFGLGDQEERSFLRATFDGEKAKYEAQLRRITKLVADGKLETEQGMRLLGEGVVADVRNYMRTGFFPPISDETVRRKGSSQPLIDTGQLAGAVTYELADVKRGR